MYDRFRLAGSGLGTSALKAEAAPSSPFFAEVGYKSHCESRLKSVRFRHSELNRD
jgi:hypothetical protein